MEWTNKRCLRRETREVENSKRITSLKVGLQNNNNTTGFTKKPAKEKAYRRYNLIRTKKLPLDLETENLGDLGENNFRAGLG